MRPLGRPTALSYELDEWLRQFAEAREKLYREA
jgi:hypothetical protein